MSRQRYTRSYYKEHPESNMGDELHTPSRKKWSKQGMFNHSAPRPSNECVSTPIPKEAPFFPEDPEFLRRMKPDSVSPPREDEFIDIGFFPAHESLDQTRDTSIVETVSHNFEKLQEEVMALRKKEREQLLEIAKKRKEWEKEINGLLMERQELMRKTKNNELQAKNLNQGVKGLDRELFANMEAKR